jgi:hypothetical protein
VLHRLLGQVGIQKTIHVVDVTAGGAHAKPKSAQDSASAAAGKPAAAAGKEAVHALPAGLTQEEIHVPTDEKDVYAYYYINKVRSFPPAASNLCCVILSSMTAMC